MHRNAVVGLWVAVGSMWLAPAQQREHEHSTKLDVQHYTINAEVNPRTQTIAATVQVQFTPLEDAATASFDLNNALNVARVVDGGGQQIPASRSQQDSTVRLSFPAPLAKGKPSTLTFTYDGHLTGTEESPVYGIKFAAIHPEFAYLLYPARWFPVNDYTADRFSADLHIIVPNGEHVIASGDGSTEKMSGDRTQYTYQFAKASFPGSIAVVQGEPVRVTSQGVTSQLYFRSRRNAAQAYGQEIGKIMAYLTSVYGLPPRANLTVVETEEGTPNGYSAPGILFLSPKGIGDSPGTRLLCNQIARQWWGALVSPSSRNHLWIQNGNARYAEMLYIEHLNGANALDTEVRDTYVEALTVDSPPVIQAARLEDFSPEYWAVTASKGAAVLHMLRNVIGNDAFFKLMRTVPEQYAWKSISTEDFRKAAETVSGKSLQPFFLQWIESSGAPQFNLEYTVFRTQKGFRVMGKVSQDLDTFRMPVDLKIETEGNPEEKRIEVVGTSSEFSVDTFGKPKAVILDPRNNVLRYSDPMRVAVAIRRGEQFAEVGEFADAIKEYQKALDVRRNSSLAHYRVGELFFLQNNFQSAANEFRESLNGDLDPKWTEVWAHVNLGKIFDITGQRERAVNEYNLALRTKDNTQGAQEEAAKYLKQAYERRRSTS